MKLNCRWRTLRGAARAGRRDAKAGKPMRTGTIVFPGTYKDAYEKAEAS